MTQLKRITIAAIAVLLLAVTAIPAFAAGEVNLTIRNRSGYTIDLVLRGPTDLELTVKQNNTIVRVVPGTYTYRYRACGHIVTGNFTVGTGGGQLRIKKCERDPNGAITIDNRTGRLIILRLFGPARYNLFLDPGNNRLTLTAGRYTYSVLMCGTTHMGEKGIKSKTNSEWVIEC
jgi:hypothetical protein